MATQILSRFLCVDTVPTSFRSSHVVAVVADEHRAVHAVNLCQFVDEVCVVVFESHFKIQLNTASAGGLALDAALIGLLFEICHCFFFTCVVIAVNYNNVRVRVLFAVSTKENDDAPFTCELLLFDGEKEVRQQCNFIDGIILAKQFASPIYIDEMLMERYASTMDIVSEKYVKKEIQLQKLKEELSNAIAAEDYERAAKINKMIEELTGKTKEK